MKFLGPSSGVAVESPDDFFGRDSFARGILKVLTHSEDPLVIALDEKWGSGKTVFAKRLIRFAAQDFLTVYFDAFEKDYEPDVFVALASEVISLVPGERKVKRELKDRAKGVAKVLGRVALKGSFRVATAGLLNSADLAEAGQDLGKELSDIAETEFDELIDQRLANAEKDHQAFEQFRSALQSICSSNGTDDRARPLLFVVDELDRCRPDYALSILETIKHFFSVNNVHFLLVCDFDQLTSSIKQRYGSIDADIYLEKFMHLRLNFPQKDERRRKQEFEHFIAAFMKTFPNDGAGGRYVSNMRDFLAKTAVRKGYSLRRIERVLTQFSLCVSFTNDADFRVGAIVFVLCDLKISNRRLFQKAKNGTLSYEEINEYYEFDDSDDQWFVRWLRYFYDVTIDPSAEEWENLRGSIGSYLFRNNISDLKTYLINNIVDQISA